MDEVALVIAMGDADGDDVAEEGEVMGAFQVVGEVEYVRQDDDAKELEAAKDEMNEVDGENDGQN